MWYDVTREVRALEWFVPPTERQTIQERRGTMTIEMFLQTVFQVSVAAAFTALCTAGVAVVIYYSYKMAEGLIRKRTKYIMKLKKSKVPFIDRPAIRMVNEGRKAVVK